LNGLGRGDLARGDDSRASQSRLPGHGVGGEPAGLMDVPVGGEHRQRVPCHPHGDPVLLREVGGGQGVAVLVLAGFDLGAQDTGELDVLGE
jgi:hypothetical protein